MLEKMINLFLNVWSEAFYSQLSVLAELDELLPHNWAPTARPLSNSVSTISKKLHWLLFY